MARLKEMRKRVMRQMAFSLFTMTVLPAATKSHGSADRTVWPAGTNSHAQAVRNLAKGYQVTDKDDIPGIPGQR